VTAHPDISQIVGKDVYCLGRSTGGLRRVKWLLGTITFKIIFFVVLKIKYSLLLMLAEYHRDVAQIIMYTFLWIACIINVHLLFKYFKEQTLRSCK
jgi:hypothetical protein